jgi:hypothetical protein
MADELADGQRNIAVVFSRITVVEFVVGSLEYRDAERKA